MAQCLPCSWKSESGRVTPVSKAARQHVLETKQVNQPVSVTRESAGSPYKRRCAECGEPAKTFWSQDGKYICENCVSEMVEDEEADREMERRLERN